MKIGTAGWLGLVSYIVAYDYWACTNNRETLTQAFHRSVDNPISRPIVAACSVILIKHLALPRLLPRLDPINHLAEHWRIDAIKEMQALQG